MGFRFRRSVKILPGVRLNFSARGMSATIGPRGASVNVGGRGTYANLGIPGTGLSYRERLDAPPKRKAGASARSRGAQPALEPREGVRPAGVDAEVARMIPLWPWVALLIAGMVVALGTGTGAGLLLGLVVAFVGAAGALGVPAHRAELSAELCQHARE